MNRLSSQRRAQVVAALVEGNSIRSTVRMTGAAKNTVIKLLVELGGVCSTFQDEVLRNLPCRRIQCDEIWSFCHAKEKNVPAEHRGQPGYGDVWTWTAICVDTKLVPSWLVGERNGRDATVFMEDVASRLAHRVQLTTDGHKPFLEAVEDAFGGEIDYAQLIKLYGADPENERRYSPAKCIGTETRTIVGLPNSDHISTSYVERQNLTMRMGMRRFTRLTKAFSKKLQNLEAAVALHFMHYNFVRVHQTLKTTPAVAAGVTDHEWRMAEIVALLDRIEQPNSN